MSILIGADFVPTKSNEALFLEGNISELLGKELLETLHNADYCIFNLELPLSDINNPIKKCGPNLVAPTAAIRTYKAIGVDLFTLANNHIMDHDKEGLLSTMKVLSENEIGFVGAGLTPSEAAQAYSFEFNGKKIGVYACAEHEFSICSDSNPGANPYDPLFSFDHVASIKNNNDYVIVLYHGGKEHYRYPSPQLQKTCRRFVDKGADLIVCQHSHCIGCEEKYLDGHIIYGQGNFLFDYSDSEFWETGLLLRINEGMNIDYIPIIKNGETVRIADKEKETQILYDFHDRSKKIQEYNFIKSQYEEYCLNNLDMYLNTFMGKNSLLYRGLNKVSRNRIRKKDLNKKYNEDILISLLNYMECEAHNELLIGAIKKKLSLR